jgi:FkbM family methyltransferase
VPYVNADPLTVDRIAKWSSVPDAVLETVTLPVNAAMSNWIKGQYPEGHRGYCVDVGASDGMFINSTWVLEKQYRWTVLSVEANPYMKPLLIKRRSFVKMCAVGAESADDVDFHMNAENLEAFSALSPVRDHPRFKEEAGERWETVKVNVRTLDQILAESEFPRLDALCIDVEGGERDVLKGIDLNKWRPRVIVAESWREGELDDALPGYERLWRQEANDAYVRRETE